MKEFAIYTALRIGLFVATFAVAFGIWAAFDSNGVPLIWPLVIAVVISAVGSLYLLKGPRERFAQKVEARAARATQAFEDMRSKEDVD